MRIPTFFNQLRVPHDLRELNELERQRADMASILGTICVKPQIVTFDPYTPNTGAQILQFPKSIPYTESGTTESSATQLN